LIFTTLFQLIKLDYKNTYYHPISLVGVVLSTFLGLSIYWYTSLAFAPALNKDLSFYGSNLFSYILIGELTILIPTHLFTQMCTKMKLSIQNGTFESFVLSPQTLPTSILMLGSSGLGKEYVRYFFTLILATLFFSLKLNSIHFIMVLGIQLLVLPAFAGLGFAACSLLLLTGRGESITSYISMILCIFAGVYFPMEVFPTFIQKWSYYLSPFNIFLKVSRDVLYQGASSPILKSGIGILLFWDVILLSFGYILLKKSFQLAQIKGLNRPITA